MGQYTKRQQLFSELGRAASIAQAIETGTWKASTTRALRQIFPEVATIELIPEIHAAAIARNRDLADVEFILGDSGNALHDLAGVRGSRPALFYLDAHAGSFYTPDKIRPRTAADPVVPDGTDTQCPLPKELAAIETWAEAGASCILIDDARVFMGPHPGFRHEDWPSFIEVVDQLRSTHRRFVTVLDDMIIAVPLSCRHVVDAWWLETGYANGKGRLAGGNQPTSVRESAKGLARAVAKSIRSRIRGSSGTAGN